MGKKVVKYYTTTPDAGFTFLGDRVQTPYQADLIVFTGGADIHPGLYGQPIGKRTHPFLQRDRIEVALFNLFKHVPKLGVCRGHQLLSVLAGASLIQDVDGHHSSHEVITFENEKFNVTSCHHQMVYLDNVDIEDYFLLAWSDKSKTYTNGHNEEISIGTKLLKDVYFEEPEILYWNNINAVTVQGHPEFAYSCERFIEYTKELCEKMVEGTIMENLTERSMKSDDNFFPDLSKATVAYEGLDEEEPIASCG